MSRTPSRRDSIVAPATPPGFGRRAVLRLSGPNLLEATRSWSWRGWPTPATERGVCRGRLEWAQQSFIPVDCLVFPGPASATGEDVLELHLPASQPVLSALLARLQERGLRLAEPGEFTRRAFLNGKLDLTQAEAVLGLIESRSAEGAQAAAAWLGGRLGQDLQRARDALTNALAEIEAGLDFEEGDAADVRPDEITPLLASARVALEEARAGQSRRADSRPVRIGLVGAPNAGKTSLFRALTGARALVSDQAGTTRDRLEAPWQPEGRTEAWWLADGPGLGGAAVDARDAAARVRAVKDVYDLIWWVVDSSCAPIEVPATAYDCPRLLVLNKIDRASDPHWDDPRRVSEVDARVAVSATTAAGFDELARQTALALDGTMRARTTRRWVGERYLAAIEQALRALAEAEAVHRSGAPSVLLAEELRAAVLALGELVGEWTPEDLLDRIFSRFCIGK